jgi:hypothetical protein
MRKNAIGTGFAIISDIRDSSLIEDMILLPPLFNKGGYRLEYMLQAVYLLIAIAAQKKKIPPLSGAPLPPAPFFAPFSAEVSNDLDPGDMPFRFGSFARAWRSRAFRAPEAQPGAMSLLPA